MKCFGRHDRPLEQICKECESRGPNGKTYEEAVELWNKAWIAKDRQTIIVTEES